MVTAHDLYRTIRNKDACIEFELLEVKVPIVFLATVGFSRPRERRYVMEFGIRRIFYSISPHEIAPASPGVVARCSKPSEGWVIKFSQPAVGTVVVLFIGYGRLGAHVTT